VADCAAIVVMLTLCFSPGVLTLALLALVLR
jgi:hypothetical protein